MGLGRTPTTTTTPGYPAGGNSNFGTGAGGNSFVPSVSPGNTNNNYVPVGAGPVSPAAGMGNTPAGGSYGAAPPALDAPGLTPPASPGAAAGAVVAPPVGPISPAYQPR
jgi:hypothetical protein